MAIHSMVGRPLHRTLLPHLVPATGPSINIRARPPIIRIPERRIIIPLVQVHTTLTIIDLMAIVTILIHTATQMERGR